MTGRSPIHGVVPNIYKQNLKPLKTRDLRGGGGIDYRGSETDELLLSVYVTLK